MWDTNNQFLSYRSRELSKVKLDSVFKSRTISLVDAANFSDFLGYVDRVLLDQPINTVEFPEKSMKGALVLKDTLLHKIYKVTLENGEYCILKQHRRSLKYSEKMCMTLLAREFKILQILGSHRNVAYAHGMTWFHDEPALVLGFESTTTLKDLLKRVNIVDRLVVQHILEGLTEALAFLQINEIIHNQITTENVCLKYNGKFYTPILVGFSNAIRKCSSRTMTIPQQEKFKDAHHLPVNVRTGKTAPSFKSDLYSFTLIIRRLSRFLSKESKNNLIELTGNLMATDFRVDLFHQLVNTYLSNL